ncbi:MAG: HD-GYP domain-containing protein [Chitinivorax sp.]
MSEADNRQYVTPDQLCVGLFVHLDLSWMDHPFTFSSFKIKSQDQIDTIRGLGLTRVRFDPAKSDVKPLAAPVATPPVAPVPAEPQPESPAILAKRQRIEKLSQQRAAIAECEKKFQGAATAVKNITRNLFARPQESLREAGELVGQMVDSMLTDKDVAIHLMNDKVAGEEVYFHSLNVAVLAMIIGKELKLSTEDIRTLGIGAMFHDIGMVEIPEKITLKTDPLTRAEIDFMRQHVQYGVDIGKRVGLTPGALAIIAQHHEYIDGTGYPKGAKGEKIYPLAKIITLVNDYDELCNHINPAESMTPHEALSLMFSQHRNRYDPPALKMLVRCLGVYPPGTIVKLSNEIIGMVVSVNSSKPLKPSVLVYDPEVPKNEAIILDLETEPEINVSKSIKPGQLPRQIYDYLSPRRRMTYFFDPSQQGGGTA